MSIVPKDQPTGTRLHKDTDPARKLRKDQDSRRLQHRNSLLKNGLWVFVGRLANVAIAALSTFVVARLLSQTEFGRFSSILAATQLLSLVGIFGLDQAVIRETGIRLAKNNPEQIPALFGLIAKLSIFAQLASAAVTCIFLYFSGATLIKETVTIGAMVATVLFTVTRSAIQTAGEAARAIDDPFGANILGGATCGALGTTLFLILLGVCAQYQQMSWKAAIGLYCVASAVPLLILLLRINRSTQQFRSCNEAPSATISLKLLTRQVALPLFLISVVAFGSSRADVLLLSFFRGPDDVAIYGAARRLTLLLSIPLGLMNMVVVTSISRLYDEGKKEELQRILQTASAIAAVPCVLACAAFLFIPEWILTVCFGEKYVVAAPILRILVPGQLVAAMSGTCSLTIIHTGHGHVALTTNVIATLFLIIAAPFTTHAYGNFGMAATMSLTIAAQNSAIWYFAGTLSKIWTHPRISIRSLINYLNYRASPN